MTNQNEQNDRNPIKYAFDVADDGAVCPMRVVRSNVIPELAPRIYRLDASPEKGLFLMPENDFNMPLRVYGNADILPQRFLRAYDLGNKNLGALLIGDPGSGKTLTLKQVATLAVEMGIPVILIDQPFPGQILTKFMSTITQQCIVCVDEFDKKYGKTDSEGESKPSEIQDTILELLDGATVGEKKMFILTANDDGKISSFLKDRPSRIRYTINYARIDQATVVDYVSTNLRNCSEEHIRAFLLLAMSTHGVYNGMNFDSMVELVSEMNYFNCDLDEATNLMLRKGNTAYGSYEVTVFHKGEKVEVTGASALHTGLYVTRGDYEIEFRITTPAPSADKPAARASVVLKREHFAHFGEDHGMFEFVYGDYTFMLTLVDYEKSVNLSNRSDKEYRSRPDVCAYEDRVREEKAAARDAEIAKGADKSMEMMDDLPLSRMYPRLGMNFLSSHGLHDKTIELPTVDMAALKTFMTGGDAGKTGTDS